MILLGVAAYAAISALTAMVLAYREGRSGCYVFSVTPYLILALVWPAALVALALQAGLNVAYRKGKRDYYRSFKDD